VGKPFRASGHGTRLPQMKIQTFAQSKLSHCCKYNP